MYHLLSREKPCCIWYLSLVHPLRPYSGLVLKEIRRHSRIERRLVIFDSFPIFPRFLRFLSVPWLSIIFCFTMFTFLFLLFFFVFLIFLFTLFLILIFLLFTNGLIWVPMWATLIRPILIRRISSIVLTLFGERLLRFLLSSLFILIFNDLLLLYFYLLPWR